MSAEHRILVIDDDEDYVKFLRLFLEEHGYATIAAYDGQEGLSRALAEKPDLILLDITMPEKSGVRCYRELRQDAEFGRTPVVMITGVTLDFRRFIHTRSQVPPPDGYLPKPVDRQELLDIIAQLLSARGTPGRSEE